MEAIMTYLVSSCFITTVVVTYQMVLSVNVDTGMFLRDRLQPKFTYYLVPLYLSLKISVLTHLQWDCNITIIMSSNDIFSCRVNHNAHEIVLIY